MMINGEMLSSIGSLLATMMFFWAMIDQFFPFLQRLFHRSVSFFNPYAQITFHEYSKDGFDRGTAYVAIQLYLAVKSKTIKDTEGLVRSMDDFIVDEFQGIPVWWTISKGQTRHFTLVFHNKYRDVIIESYINHVLARGEDIAVKNRRRMLYTNSKQESSGSGSIWTHVAFEHTATFETLALEPEMKKDIVDDLIAFSKGKDFYERVGKVWKRGYLLYGPPGTGKSTMVAAMANLLEYDVYDIDLTSVENNTELKNLLINTSGKSIIVFEDIDRYFDLSGLLNFIDGLWSACFGERIFVFTTNYLEKLDPASIQIRTGRMDKYIKMSYCSFEVFKVLARNYLGIKSHNLFGRVKELLEEIDMTPADVVEYLIPKSAAEEDRGRCLDCLITALECAKVAADIQVVKDILKAKEEEKIKAAKEVKKKVGG